MENAAGICDCRNANISVKTCSGCGGVYDTMGHVCPFDIIMPHEEKIKIASLEAELIEDEARFAALEKRVNALEIEQQIQIELLPINKNKPKNSVLFWFVLLGFVALHIVIALMIF